MYPSFHLAKLLNRSAVFIESFSKNWLACPALNALLSGGRYLGAMLVHPGPVSNSGSQRERAKVDKKVRERVSARFLPVSSGSSESRCWRDEISTRRIVTVQS